MDEWTFGPVYPEVYATISPKVIVVGAEPNEQANRFPGRDMGQLLRLAPSNNYWGYEFYYRATLQQVRAVLTNIADQSDEGILRHVRYVDLKATGGGGSSRTAAVRNWVRDHLERIANYWLTDRPEYTVLQGNHAQVVFEEILATKLVGCGVEGRKVGLLHPSQRNQSHLTDTAYLEALKGIDKQLCRLDQPLIQWDPFNRQWFQTHYLRLSRQG